MCKWTPKLDNQKSPVEYVFTNTLTRGNKICEKYIKQFSVGESEKLTINGVLFDLTYLGEKRLVVGSGDTRSEAPGERWLVNGNEEHVYYFANILQNHVVEEIRDVKVNIMGKQGGGHLYPSGFIQIDEENYYPSECGEGQLAQFIEEIRSEYMLWKLEMGIYRKEWILLILFLIPIVLGVIYYFKKRKRRE
ncbi:hypothetical protein CL630_01860 [bacterium]|nr:hypothetical protein [bacterium]